MISLAVEDGTTAAKMTARGVRQMSTLPPFGATLQVTVLQSVSVVFYCSIRCEERSGTSIRTRSRTMLVVVVCLSESSRSTVSGVGSSRQWFTLLQRGCFSKRQYWAPVVVQAVMRSTLDCKDYSYSGGWGTAITGTARGETPQDDSESREADE